MIKDYVKIERAADLSRSEVGRLGTAVLFIVAVMIFTGARYGHVEQSYLLVAAALGAGAVMLKPKVVDWAAVFNPRR